MSQPKKPCTASPFILVAATLCILFCTSGQASSQKQDSIVVPEIVVTWAYYPEYFPESWASPPVSFYARGVSKAERVRCDRIFKLFIYKYVPMFINFHAQRFAFFEYMKMYGRYIPYLCKDDRILILDIGAERGATDEWIEFALHRCFAEMVWKVYGSPELKKQFMALNPFGFKYDYRTLPSDFDGSMGFDLEPRLFSHGFSTLISTESFENDFFGISAQLFMARKEFGNAVLAHPALRKKVMLVIDYYKNIDGRMDIKWFTERLPGLRLPQEVLDGAMESY